MTDPTATRPVAFVTGAAWRLRERCPYLLVGWLWYLGTLVPVIGIVQVGGQAMADRYTYIPLIGIFIILAWGAFTAGLIPLVAKPVLRMASDSFDQLQVGILFGSFTAVLVLFSIPVILLGTISPYAIRLAIKDPNEAGRVSGRVYAISTMGSFIGTFLAVLVMILRRIEIGYAALIAVICLLPFAALAQMLAFHESLRRGLAPLRR